MEPRACRSRVDPFGPQVSLMHLSACHALPLRTPCTKQVALLCRQGSEVLLSDKGYPADRTIEKYRCGDKRY